MILPGSDGIDHINVFSRGNTELGRWMSNFHRQAITLPKWGEFQSVEGFWYWLGTQDDRLRNLHGFQAKQLGRSLPNVQQLEPSTFRQQIIAAIRAKHDQAPKDMQSKFKESELPFCHYYVFNGTKRDAGYEWIISFWEQLRGEQKNH